MNRSPDHEETFIYTYGFDYIVMVKAIFNGWVSEWLLIVQQFFNYISWREQVNFQWDDDEVALF
jgi:hypothetical protein